MTKYLIALLFTLFPILASAQSNIPSEEPRDMLVFEESTRGQAEEAMEISFEYNGLKVEAAELSLPDSKEKILEMLQQEMAVERDTAKNLYLPIAPETKVELKSFANLSQEEMTVFLRKKKTFLRRFASTLSFFKLKTSWINKAVKEVNAKFFKSSRLIANSNTSGVAFSGAVGIGLALPSKVVSYLKKRPLGRFIPESGGFYYMLGLGVGIVRKIDPVTKKKSMFFELFADAESLKKTVSGILEITVSGTGGVIYEHRENDFMSQKVNVTYGGAAGLFRAGENHFGWSGSLGMSMPPGIGAFLVYDTNSIRKYFVRINLTKVFVELPGRIFANLAGLTSSLRARSCSRVY